MALLAPEAVAWNAWEQRRRVKSFTQKMQDQLHWGNDDVESQQILVSKYTQCSCVLCKLSRWIKLRWHGLKTLWHKGKVLLGLDGADRHDGTNNESKSERNQSPRLWTDHHSWYALMGGFAFDVSGASEPILPGGREQLTITLEGLLMLAKYWPHLIPRISRADIEDKSKNDSLAKALTCWQAIWFCAQCISRLADRLPITLLELNVFGHAFCTLLTYAIWWHKPKDVQEPTKLTGDECVSVAAIMYNLSPLGQPMVKASFHDPLGRGWSTASFDRWTERVYWTPYPPGPTELQSNKICWSFPEPTRSCRPIDSIGPGSLRIGDRSWTLRTVRGQIQHYGYTFKVAFDDVTVSRLKAIQHYTELHTCLNDASEDNLDFDALVSVRSHDWCIKSHDIRVWHLPFWNAWHLHLAHWTPYLGVTLFGTAIASALYGGLHATAWNAPFPSAPEALLWRASSATVTASGTALFTLYVFLLALPWLLWRKGPRSTMMRKPRPSRGIFEESASLKIVALAAILWYLLCRSFLVVECCISLAYLSHAMLYVSSWSRYASHLS